MFKNLVIIALLAASISCQQRTIKGCFSFNKDTNTCTACYRRMITSSGGCGPLLPETDPCSLYGGGAGQAKNCMICKQGYGLSPRVNNPCIPQAIFGCRYTLNFGYNGIKCEFCGAGLYPTPDLSS